MMKRSDMVLLIMDTLRNYVTTTRDLEVASRKVLKRMEDAGISPPGYMKPIPCDNYGRQYPLVPGDFQDEEDRKSVV